MDLKDRIALGTQFLDSVKPGWTGEIDTDELDLSMPTSCILGQLFTEESKSYDNIGPFTVGSWAAHDWLVEQGYGLDDEAAEEYVNAAEMCGFERDGAMGGRAHSDADTYDKLQAAWLEVITTHV